MTTVVAGIDLAASEKKSTAICFMTLELYAETYKVKKDEEIIKLIVESGAKIVGIDAPLSFPISGPYRDCDLELLRRGIRLFSPLFGPMKALTARGIKLKKKLEGAGIKVYEVFPGGTQDVLGLPRKKKGKHQLLSGLRNLGIKGLSEECSLDELDAATAALTIVLYVKGLAEKVEGENCLILLPRPEARNKLQSNSRA